MGVLSGAGEYLSNRMPRTGVHADGLSYDMTTDPDEGRRQIEAMHRWPPFVVGDLVRLKAGGERVMTVINTEDYGNMAVCQWQVGESGLERAERETFPVGSLVKVDDGEQAGTGP